VTLSPSIATLLGVPISASPSRAAMPKSKPVAVLPEHCRVRHERAGGLRSGQLQHLPDPDSFDKHEAQPGRLLLNEEVPAWVRRDLFRMGYRLETRQKTSGPITAIYFDWEHNTSGAA